MEAVVARCISGSRRLRATGTRTRMGDTASQCYANDLLRRTHCFVEESFFSPPLSFFLCAEPVAFLTTVVVAHTHSQGRSGCLDNVPSTEEAAGTMCIRHVLKSRESTSLVEHR